jgi:hypothetical protein
MRGRPTQDRRSAGVLDAARCEEVRSADQDLRDLRPAFCLAKEVGAGVGRGSLLLQAMRRALLNFFIAGQRLGFDQPSNNDTRRASEFSLHRAVAGAATIK